jgi:hypothetical protein
VPLPDKLDLRAISDVEKHRALQAVDPQIQYMLPENMMEGSAMAACWQEVLVKGAGHQPFVKPGRVVWLDPQTIAPATQSQHRLNGCGLECSTGHIK